MIYYHTTLTEKQLDNERLDLFQDLASVRGITEENAHFYDRTKGIRRCAHLLRFNQTGTVEEASIIEGIVLKLGLIGLIQDTELRKVYPPKYGGYQNTTKSYCEHTILLMMFNAKYYNNNPLRVKAKSKLVNFRKSVKLGEIKPKLFITLRKVAVLPN